MVNTCWRRPWNEGSSRGYRLVKKYEPESLVGKIAMKIAQCRSFLLTPSKILLGRKTFVELQECNAGNDLLDEKKKTVFGTLYEIGTKQKCYRIWDSLCEDAGRSITDDKDYITHCTEHLSMNNFDIVKYLKDEED